MDITLPELEEAINYWRTARPSTGEESALSPEVDSLAELYALMIFHGSKAVPLESAPSTCRQLIEAWRRQAA